MVLRAPAAALLAIGISGCNPRRASDETTPPEPPSAATPEGAAETAAPTATQKEASKPAPTPAGPCPADMRLVAGSYCLAVEHRCLAWQEAYEGGIKKKNQCSQFREPSTCFEDRRKPLRFCMDTYEWPNEKGSLPRMLTSWEQARDLCTSKGKRLCTEEEFNFACEGESLRPHVYGYVRDDKKCNIDRAYRPRSLAFSRWDDCMADEECHRAFEAIDQRVPSGSMPECVNESGVYDLNGNANEWVIRPLERSPNRSGLKGGWWGPVRNRCRPTVTFHNEGDWGYEVGFRCCAEPKTDATSKAEETDSG